MTELHEGIEKALAEIRALTPAERKHLDHLVLRKRMKVSAALAIVKTGPTILPAFKDLPR